jgi:hypothetical protein
MAVISVRIVVGVPDPVLGNLSILCTCLFTVDELSVALEFKFCDVVVSVTVVGVTVARPEMVNEINASAWP